MDLPIDRRQFITGLGGASAVALMSHEARADAVDDALLARLETPSITAPARSGEVYPTVAEIEKQIPTRHFRRGTGGLFYRPEPGATVTALPRMPERSTLLDFFALRFERTRNHCLQSANKALQRGADEEIVLACLLHDTSQELMRADHGFWGAQMYEPYVSERVTFAIRYHQALRFYPDEKAGYEYPALYKRLFGGDYVPEPHVKAAYEFARRHKWYDAPREVTVSDLYAFDPKAVVKIDPFVDLIGRHFKQPKEGLGQDGSAVAHMWRTIANPDAPL
ncbi:MAG: hypothetical protein ABW136_00130 [Steroidobacteraceae bacterium]